MKIKEKYPMRFESVQLLPFIGYNIKYDGEFNKELHIAIGWIKWAFIIIIHIK